MPSAEIITIGTELLLGEIQDTNTRYLARYLRDLGIDLFRATIVGDNPQRIAVALQEAASRSDMVITTGGLGPTVDDPTRHAVALALGVELEFIPELWEQIQERFRKYGRTATENNRQQALIPKGAKPISNPVGTAPAFLYDTGKCVFISVPGVPREMEYLMENEIAEYLHKRFNLHGVIKARVLHSAGVGESQVDEWVADLEKMSNPTVGLLAHPGQTDIRVTAKANSVQEADALIQPVIDEIQKRLSEHIYGMDEDTLESVVTQLLDSVDLKMVILECNLGGRLMERLKDISYHFVTHLSPEPMSETALIKKLKALMQQDEILTGLAVSVHRISDFFQMDAVFIHESHAEKMSRRYAGPPSLINLWAGNITLDFLRRNLIHLKLEKQ